MPRKTNQQICVEFRALLTEGAKIHFDNEELQLTKQFRSDIWKAFMEIEKRLCPLETGAIYDD